MNKSYLAIVLVLLCALATASAQVMFKFGAQALPVLFTNWYLYLGLLCYGLGFLLLIVSFKWGEVTILYPILATSYVWVTLYAKFIFAEQVSLSRWMGVGLIMIGIAIMGIAGNHKSSLQYTGAVQ